MQKINNVDIVLQSGNATDICFDMDYYKEKHMEIDKKEIIEKVRSYLSDEQKAKFSFSIEPFEKAEYTNSSSSFQIDKGKKDILYVKIEDKKVDINKIIEENGNERTIIFSEEEERSLFIKILKKNELVFEDTHIKIGELGDVVFSSVIKFRDADMTVEEYAFVSDKCRKICRNTLKSDFSTICELYCEAIMDLVESEKNEYKLLQVKLQNFEEKEKRTEYVKEMSLYALTWGHIFYDGFSQDKEMITGLKEAVITDECERHTMKEMELEKIKMMIGWSHFIIITSATNEKERKDLIQFYKLPHEFMWGKFIFLKKMNLNMEDLIYRCYSIFENRRKRKKVKKYKREIDKLYFFMNRAIDAYDTNSISINQTQAKMMKDISFMWGMEDLRGKYDTKMEALKELIEYVSTLQNAERSKLLNGILFLIAVLSTIDLSNSLYNLFMNGFDQNIFVTTAPITTIFVVMFLYVRLSSR